jgi:hypothetical protein
MSVEEEEWRLLAETEFVVSASLGELRLLLQFRGGIVGIHWLLC